MNGFDYAAPATLAEALAIARTSASDHPLTLATAWSFIALGAA